MSSIEEPICNPKSKMISFETEIPPVLNLGTEGVEGVKVTLELSIGAWVEGGHKP
jgi:hypothetical protein